jgi:hypothetical protein
MVVSVSAGRLLLLLLLLLLGLMMGWRRLISVAAQPKQRRDPTHSKKKEI